MKHKYILICVMIIIEILLCGCSYIDSTTDSIAGIEYKYVDSGFPTFSLDEIQEQELLKYVNITPEVAAYIAKGVFIEEYGEDFVNDNLIKVYDNTETIEDKEKYGEFYQVSCGKEDTVVISKQDGRILGFIIGG